MASNVREIELALQVSTTNADAIRNLQTDVAKLAKESGDAAPEFKRLADELDKLATEAQGLQSLDKLATNLTQVAAAQAGAADKARDLTTQYNTLKAATDAASATQAGIKTELTATRNSVQEYGDQIKLLNAQYAVSERSSYEYVSKLAELATNQNTARASVREMRVELGSAEEATRKARNEQNGLSTAYRNANTQADALTGKLAGMKTDYDALARATLGVSGAQADLVGATAKLTTELNKAATETDQLVAAQKQAAAATKAQADAQAAAAADAAANAKLIADYHERGAAAAATAQARVTAAIQKQANESKAAGQAIREAFGVVGAKSVEELEAKIASTRKAVELLKSSGALMGPELKVATKQGEQAIADLEREIRKANGSLTMMDKATNLWNQSMGGMKVGTLVAVGAVSALFQKVMEIGPAFVSAVSKNELFVQSLNNIFKSSTVAAEQIAFLRGAANTAGVGVGELQQGFVKFSAAMTGANIPLSQSNALFSALTKAGGSLGLSTDAVNRAMEALGQMASKGTVSMEELRQQLGDALPGALGMAAKGLGMTETEVIKLVSSGQLAAKDFFPAFTTGLATVSGEANSLSQNFARLTNAVNAFFISLGDAGGLDILKAGMEATRVVAQVFGMGIATITETVLGSTRATAAFAATLAAGGSFQAALNASGQEVKNSADRLAKLNDAFRGVESSSGTASTSLTGSATALAGMEAAGAAAGSALLKLNVAIGEEAEKLAHTTSMAELNAKTVDAQSDAQIKAAKAIGDVNQSLDLQITANAAAVTSLEALAVARGDELKLLQGQFEATKLLLEADGLLDKADAERLLTMAQAIEKQGELVKAIKAKIEASKEDLVQSELEKQMLVDNSGKMFELIGRYNEATEAVKKLRAEKAAGKPVDDELTLAIQKQGAAYKMAKDAIDDSTKAEQAKLVSLKASNAVAEASLQLQMNSAKSLESLANATGNHTLAIRAKVAQMEIEIKMSQAKATMLKAEADAEEAIANAKLRSLKLSGEINPVQEAELEAVGKISEAKRIQASAIEKSNEVIQREINALNTGTTALDNHAGAAGKAGAAQDSFGRSTTAATAALEAQNAALERNISAQEKANDLKERAAALDRKAKNVDKNGFTLDNNGNTMQQYYNPAADRAMKATSRRPDGTYDPAEYAKHLAYYQAQLDEQIAKAGERGKNSVSGGAALFGDTPGTSASNSRATSTKPAGGAAKTYNVTFNGQTVAANSDADAQKLMGMLKAAKGSA